MTLSSVLTWLSSSLLTTQLEKITPFLASVAQQMGKTPLALLNEQLIAYGKEPKNPELVSRVPEREGLKPPITTAIWLLVLTG